MSVEERYELERRALGQRRYEGDRPWQWPDLVRRMRLTPWLGLKPFMLR